jgi:hypothetical protein
MYYLTYVSSASRPFTKQELVDLLTHARANNSKRDITGMLLYKDGNFIQILEGQKDVVENLYARISRDPRHHDMIILDQGVTSARQFRDWSMGFRDLSDLDLHALPGFSQFMNKPVTIEPFRNDPTACHELLNFFKDSR